MVRSRTARPAPTPAVVPDQRAENTPGEPPSTSTASPESSATAGRPVASASAAAFVCAAVVALPDGRVEGVEGRVTGTLVRSPRGTNGFGYDPVFVPEGETRTVAELGDDWKRANSHRARAAAALRAALENATAAS